jgi:hypothetical protein
MGTCVHYVSKQTVLPGGEKLVRGLATLASSYATGGDVLNLANYFDEDGSPTVVTCSADGYVTEHNQGTAAKGTIICYYNIMNADTTNGVSQNTALYQVDPATDLDAVNVIFTAVGKAY